MSLTLDQKINIAIAVGTCFAAIATFCAVLVALKLAMKVEKVKLKVFADIQLAFVGDGTPAKRLFSIDITNLAERNVTIDGLTLISGKGKNKKYGFMLFDYQHSVQPPKQLAYSENAKFIALASDVWAKGLSDYFFKDGTKKFIKNSIIRINTSVGQKVDVKPGNNFIDLMLSQQNISK